MENQFKKDIKSIELDQPSAEFTNLVMQKIYQDKTNLAYKPLISRKLLFIVYGLYISLFLINIVFTLDTPPIGLPEIYFKGKAYFANYLTPPVWMYFLLTIGSILILIDSIIYFIKQRGMKQHSAGFGIQS